ncbi:magnesium transporter, partial [Phenoliferia sp. Uapishka_3]
SPPLSPHPQNSAILSSIFLGETLTFFGKIGCLLCILGATIVALNGPQEATTSTIPAFQKLFLSPGFLVYMGLVICVCLGLVFFVAPKYGKTNMLVYISICSLIGGLSVACTQGLGSSILTSIRGDNQFKHWFIYFLLGFVVLTLGIEINYLNKALELFNTAMGTAQIKSCEDTSLANNRLSPVTPTYYVLFTGATLVTSTILYQGFKASAVDIVTVVMGFLVICSGISKLSLPFDCSKPNSFLIPPLNLPALLQLSKVDPTEIKGNIDRKSTMLLSASRSEIHHDGDLEKDLEIEDPGIDALRGGFGAIGSIHRAISGRRSMRREGAFDPSEVVRRRQARGGGDDGESGLGMGVVRHQLYDNPMPMDASDKISMYSGNSGFISPRPQFSTSSDLESPSRDRAMSLTFAPQDNLHLYSAKHAKKGRDDEVIHEQIAVQGRHMHGPRELVPRELSASPNSIDVGAEFPSSSFTSPTFPYPATGAAEERYVDPYDKDRRGNTVPQKMKTGSGSSSNEFGLGGSNERGSQVSPKSMPKSRFPLPFRGASHDRTRDSHRVPHPAGAEDMDREESASLVHRREESEDFGAESEEEEGFSELKGWETRESGRL